MLEMDNLMRINVYEAPHASFAFLHTTYTCFLLEKEKKQTKSYRGENKEQNLTEVKISLTHLLGPCRFVLSLHI